jgi:hypothetical protein
VLALGVALMGLCFAPLQAQAELSPTASAVAQSELSPLAPVGGESAFPFKSSSDTGVINHFTSTPSRGCSNGGLCVVGWDACVYSALLGNFTQTLQQYTVPGCTPVQTPWIHVTGGRTSGWAVYCPSKAPYSWVNGYPGSQGQTFQWWTDNQYVGSFSQPPGTNTSGPNPPAKIDFSVHDWSVYSHNWLFVAACSTVSNQNIPQQPPYSHGDGPSARPTGLPGVSSIEETSGGTPRGPAMKITKGGPRSYVITRQFKLKPNRKVTYRVSCRRGYRQVTRRWAIGWYTTGPPKRADGTATATRLAAPKRTLAVRVRTNKRVQPGTAQLQVVLGCRR